MIDDKYNKESNLGIPLSPKYQEALAALGRQKSASPRVASEGHWEQVGPVRLSIWELEEQMALSRRARLELADTRPVVIVKS